MSDTASFLISEAGEALESLRESFVLKRDRVEVLARLGWTLPPGFDDIGFKVTLVETVVAKWEALLDLLDRENSDKAEIAKRVKELVDAIDAFRVGMRSLMDSLSTSLPLDYLNKTQIHKELLPRLLHLVLLEHLQVNYPGLLSVLKLLGLVRIEDVPADPDIFQSEHQRFSFHFEILASIFDPKKSWLRDAYGWGTANARVPDLVGNASDLLSTFGGSVDVWLLSREGEELIVGHPAPEADTDPTTQVVIRLESLLADLPQGTGIAVTALRPDNAAGDNAGIGLLPFWAGGPEVPLFVGDGKWFLVLSAPPAEVASGLLAVFRPGLPVQLRAQPFQPTPGPPGDARRGIGLAFKDPSGAESLLLSTAFGTSLFFQEASFIVGAETKSGASGAFFELGLKRGRLAIATDEMDGLVSSAAGGGADSSLVFDTTIRYSTVGGLTFAGSAGLELAIPLNQDLGAARLASLRLQVTGQEGALAVTAGLDGRLTLGPVVASFENMGIKSVFALEDGNLGPIDLRLKFKPPTGVGIAVNAGPVTGGGFLFFDEPNGRYGGALVLKIYSVTVKAFGVVETKLPDGTKGFSFVIVISAEFTPIQLGLGFTLNGVGGMIGINRRIEEDGLRRAVRDGSLGHLLFPHNLEENAPQIIHDLVAVLPAAEGRYVFGPMAKIGWGSPTLIEADLGIILELPGPRLALLGEVRAALPKRDKALVLINLSVAGLLDFPRKFFAIDASLHDSRVGSYPITGDMAMRLSWGDDPTFALAVGGFNPGFQPPPSFPKLRRVAVDLGISGNPSLTLQGYFALTSNTAQIGALAELKASGSGIQLYARVQFDALIVFSPFAFEVAIDAQARVSFHGRGIGVHLHGVVNGPSPWRVRGEVCVSILWWDACLGFDKTFGKGERVELAQIDPWLGTKVPGTNKTDVLGLQEALQDTRNWTPELPPGAQQVVSVSEPPAGEDGRPVDPLGAATARERVCPLRKQLDRFGQVKPAGPGRFDLESAQINGKTIDVTKDISYVKEPFAPAQYFNMSDSEKLSAPSFQKLDGGLTVKGNARNIAPGSIEPKNIEYQTKVLGGPQPTKNHFFTDVRLEGMRKRSGTGLFGLRRLGAEAYLDPTAARKFTLDDELFVIANINDLTTRTDLTATPITKIEALFKLRDHRAANPSAGPLAVVPKFEVGAR